LKNLHIKTAASKKKEKAKPVQPDDKKKLKVKARNSRGKTLL